MIRGSRENASYRDESGTWTLDGFTCVRFYQFYVTIEKLIDKPSRSHAVLGSLFTRYDITFLSLLLRKLSRIITREKITIYLISWIISVSSD